ncbi:MAG: ADP-ribosylglycohydrolase family protein [Muribaculaceae bacterium]|nr:ADP-ribosylglycohydrolase family protein [Muribaculaceae bacterium]
MIGAIIGDIVGSPYEFANTSDIRFPLFSKRSSYTDDSICTVAVADALVRGSDFGSTLREWCRRYPNPMGAYGCSFNAWLHSNAPRPYNSYGNGAAMRVAAVGWAFDTEAQTLRAAMASAAPTHNHVEGLIGASTVARGIFILRDMIEPTFNCRDIDSLLESSYGMDWERHLPAPGVFDETCQGCVPLAFAICCEANGFEDALRKAVVYGGDSDTLGAIVGALAEARWGIPEDIKRQALQLLPPDMLEVIGKFSDKFGYKY